MNSLQLKFRGDPVLSKKSREVVTTNTPEFMTFCQDLVKACFQYDGVGIAAPQVGYDLQVFIMLTVDSDGQPDSGAHLPEIVINPKILSHSEEMEEDWEGCLSVPGMRGQVNRYTEIEVEYITPAGQQIRKSLQGFQARVFQHEFDHLQGTLYPDRMEKGKELVTIEELERMLDKEAE